MTADEYFGMLKMHLDTIVRDAVFEAEPYIKELVKGSWDAGEDMEGNSFYGIMIDNGGPYDGMRYRSLDMTGEMRERLTINSSVELESTAPHANAVERQVSGEGVSVYSVRADERLADIITTYIKERVEAL